MVIPRSKFSMISFFFFFFFFFKKVILSDLFLPLILINFYLYYFLFSCRNSQCLNRFGWSSGPEKLVWYGIYSTFKVLQGFKIEKVRFVLMLQHNFITITNSFCMPVNVTWVLSCPGNWKEFSVLCHWNAVQIK